MILVFGSAGIMAVNLPSAEENSFHAICCKFGQALKKKKSEARIRVCINSSNFGDSPASCL